MSTDTTIPTIADIQSQIHTLPGRPPIMIAADVAEMFETSPKNFLKQVRGNLDLFTPEMMIELTSEEMERSWRFQSANFQGKRTDLTKLGFTEQGVMMAATLMRSKRAKQMVQVIVCAFIEQREATITAMRHEFAITKQEYIGKIKIRQQIVAAASEGVGYVTLHGRWDYGHRLLVAEIEAMRVRGYIPQDALTPPLFILRKLEAAKTFIAVHVEDTHQMRLGLED